MVKEIPLTVSKCFLCVSDSCHYSDFWLNNFSHVSTPSGDHFINSEIICIFETLCQSPVAENMKIAERKCGILLLGRSGFPRAVLLFLLRYNQRILHRSGWIARFIWEVNKIYGRRNVNVLLHWCTILGCARQAKNPIYVEHFLLLRADQ